MPRTNAHGHRGDRERHVQVKLEAELGRIPILDVAPVVGCGRWPAKAVVGETVEVS
ncbi:MULTISPECIES: maltotransferase domain-containing protein, partial [unclassified Spirillospora]|uniref:maltotransferase domain-containing protein n=1 Tax=unclassified Spirillospora TaxID=2642701 RepID=UPI003720C5CF